MRRPWTSAEIRILRTLAPNCPAKLIAACLGRTPAAVHQQACIQRIPLQKRGNADYRTKYPDEVVERCRELHERGQPPSAIANITGVPKGLVKSFVYFRGRVDASLVLTRKAA